MFTGIVEQTVEIVSAEERGASRRIVLPYAFEEVRLGESIAEGWKQFLIFALYVVGVSNGVQLWKLEQYLRPESSVPAGGKALDLSAAAIALEVYRTIVLVLQGLAWALLLFFTISLVAFAILKLADARRPRAPGES